MAISGGMINNPKRSVSVEMDINNVKKLVKNLCKIYTSIDKDNKLSKEDDFTNTYQYKIKEDGLSFGAVVVITLKKDGESSTSVEVETQRVMGSYDTDIEVTEANRQIDAIFSALSSLSTKNINELDNLVICEDEKITTNTPGLFGAIIFAAISIAALIVILSIC